MTRRWRGQGIRHSRTLARRGLRHAVPGFTLIEVVVAIGILSMVIISVFMLVTVSAANLKDSDMRNTATNITNYTIEYIRSRNVTSDNNFIGTSDWYSATNLSGQFPGLVDLGSGPVGSNTTVAALTINVSPALPADTYSTKSTAFYSSLQGYVSLADSPSAATPSVEDGNANVVSGKYNDRITGAPYVVRFPLSGSSAIKNFTSLSGYNAMIYTSNTTNESTSTSSPNYDMHYTGTKTNTMAYTGFRVLTQIVARKALAADPVHVQYYDIQVTVFWMVGSAEHSYSVATQIATY
jgi:type II secretory pathway pseudopilin PulG